MSGANKSSIVSISNVPASGQAAIYVFGHKNPDSDAICSAIVTADWLRHQGKPAVAFRLGDINRETRFILARAEVAVPALLPEAEDLADKDVWLVDFTDAEQGPATLAAANVIGIIDHHRLGTLTTRQPPDVRIQPVGSCGTLVWRLIAGESDMALSAAQAVLLLGAILSDTVGLSSSTTTELDRPAVNALFRLTSLERKTFIGELLAAKTDISGLTAVQLINKDAKNYRIHGVNLILAQLELNAMREVEPRLPELLTTINALRDTYHQDMIILMVTDIHRKQSTLWFSDNGITGPMHISLLGAVSRKKDVLPWLTQQLTQPKR